MDIKSLSSFENRCIVNGNYITTEKTIPVYNPIDNSLICEVPSLDEAIINEAILTSYNSQKEWKKKSANERSNFLKKWNNLILENLDELATIMTLEQGKPLKESKAEILYACSYIEWFAEEAKRAYGDVIPSDENSEVIVVKEPIGVCVAITPWNFPAAMITRKVAPALAAGCSIIIKPASETPLTAFALVKLAHKANIPKGVMNIVTGPSRLIGDILTESPLVKKISFTGSTSVGAMLLEKSGKTLKKMSLELGGNAPVLIFDNCDLDKAVDGVINSKYRNAGQTCVCANRIYVQETIYDQFIDLLKQKVQLLKVGNGMDEETDIGPMINREAVQKVEFFVNDAISKGATLVCGSKKNVNDGNWYPPSILKDVTHDMLCAKEEIFGPLAPIFKFNSESEAISMANDTEFGLASYIFTNDLKQYIRVSRALEYGMIGVNTGLISNAAAPFGGIKNSGMGREGSKYGLEEYLEIKYICIGNLA